MQPELIGISTKNGLLNLHSINVLLANYIFMYRVSKFFSIIKTMTNMTRITSILLWIISTAIPFYSSQQSVLSASLNNLNLFYTVLYPILNFIGIPALLFKFIPKIIGYIIRYRILQNLHVQYRRYRVKSYRLYPRPLIAGDPIYHITLRLQERCIILVYPRPQNYLRQEPEYVRSDSVEKYNITKLC